MRRATRYAFTFNTRRQYQPAGHKFAGQVISVEAVHEADEITVKFYDRSRGLDGAFKTALTVAATESAIVALVMDFYDNNRHVAIDYFEHLEREAAKAAAPRPRAITKPSRQRAPTAEQLAALQAWRDAMGKQWRSKLLAAWERAGEGYSAYVPALQHLRNTFGPSWLVRVKLAPTPSSPPAISGAAFDGCTGAAAAEPEPELGETPQAKALAAAAATPARIKFEILIRAALEVLDEPSLTEEQRALADAIYGACNSLEYTFDDVPS